MINLLTKAKNIFKKEPPITTNLSHNYKIMVNCLMFNNYVIANDRKSIKFDCFSVYISYDESTNTLPSIMDIDDQIDYTNLNEPDKQLVHYIDSSLKQLLTPIGNKNELT